MAELSGSIRGYQNIDSNGENTSKTREASKIKAAVELLPETERNEYLLGIIEQLCAEKEILIAEFKHFEDDGLASMHRTIHTLDVEKRNLSEWCDKLQNEVRELEDKNRETSTSYNESETRVQFLMDRVVALLSNGSSESLQRETVHQMFDDAKKSSALLEDFKSTLEVVRSQNKDIAQRLSEEQRLSARLHAQLCDAQKLFFSKVGTNPAERQTIVDVYPREDRPAFSPSPRDKKWSTDHTDLSSISEVPTPVSERLANDQKDKTDALSPNESPAIPAASSGTSSQAHAPATMIVVNAPNGFVPSSQQTAKGSADERRQSPEGGLRSCPENMPMQNSPGMPPIQSGHGVPDTCRPTFPLPLSRMLGIASSMPVQPSAGASDAPVVKPAPEGAAYARATSSGSGSLPSGDGYKSSGEPRAVQMVGAPKMEIVAPPAATSSASSGPVEPPKSMTPEASNYQPESQPRTGLSEECVSATASDCVVEEVSRAVSETEQVETQLREALDFACYERPVIRLGRGLYKFGDDRVYVKQVDGKLLASADSISFSPIDAFISQLRAGSVRRPTPVPQQATTDQKSASERIRHRRPETQQPAVTSTVSPLINRDSERAVTPNGIRRPPLQVSPFPPPNMMIAPKVVPPDQAEPRIPSSPHDLGKIRIASPFNARRNISLQTLHLNTECRNSASLPSSVANSPGGSQERGIQPFQMRATPILTPLLPQSTSRPTTPLQRSECGSADDNSSQQTVGVSPRAVAPWPTFFQATKRDWSPKPVQLHSPWTGGISGRRYESPKHQTPASAPPKTGEVHAVSGPPLANCRSLLSSNSVISGASNLRQIGQRASSTSPLRLGGTWARS